MDGQDEDRWFAGAPAPVPVCSSHPDRVSVATCARCGSFLCDACAAPDPVAELAGAAPTEQVLCAACTERVGTNVPPWEDISLQTPIGFVRTWRAITVDMARTFSRLGGVDWARTWWFVAGNAFLFAVSSQLLLMATSRERPNGLCGVMGTVISPVGALIYGSMVHGSATLFGGRGHVVTTIRAALYAYPIAFLARAVAVFVQIAMQATRTASYVYIALTLSGVLVAHAPLFFFARGRLGLSSLRAIAALLPPLALALTMTTLTAAATLWPHELAEWLVHRMTGHSISSPDRGGPE